MPLPVRSKRPDELPDDVPDVVPDVVADVVALGSADRGGGWRAVPGTNASSNAGARSGTGLKMMKNKSSPPKKYESMDVSLKF